MMRLPGLRPWFLSVLLGATLALAGLAIVHAGQAATSIPATAESAPPPLQQESALSSLAVLTKTIGRTTDCSSGGDSLDAEAGAIIYYCYSLQNIGMEPIRPIPSTLFDQGPDGDVLVNWIPPYADFTLAPGETLLPTLDNGLIRAAQAPSSNSVFTASWAIEPVSGGLPEVVTSNPTTLNIARLAIAATFTVGGTDPNACPTATTLTYPFVNFTYSDPIYYCLTIQNNSNIPLVWHTISVPALGLYNFRLQATIQPVTSTPVSNTLKITNKPFPQTQPDLFIRQFASPMIAPVVVATAIVTSTAEDPALTVSTKSNDTTASGPPAAISVTKSFNTDPGACVIPSTIPTFAAGTRLYYCVIISNNNSFTFTQASLTELPLNINFSFNTILPPGSRITVTNNYLSSIGVTPALGPFIVTTSINNVMAVVASNPQYKYTAAASASASMFFLASTPTPTDRPTATFTPFPFDTSTPTPTWTPLPPTWTPIPTLTPVPTWTPSPTVIVITTPGGLPPTPYPTLNPIGSGGFNSPLNPTEPVFDFPTPIIDPVGATATALAAGFPTPIMDPVGATATALANFGFPTPIIDPVGATATALANAGFPTPILDPAGATATALAFTSPLATPTIDPVIAQQLTAQASGAFPTPILDPGGATATALALYLPPATPTPSAPTVAPFAPVVTLITTPATAEGGPTGPPTEAPISIPPVAAGVFTQTLQTAGMTFAILWFLGGLVVFFLVAGVLAGLSYRNRSHERFDLQPDPAGDFEVQAPPVTPAPLDEDWPASLP